VECHDVNVRLLLQPSQKPRESVLIKRATVLTKIVMMQDSHYVRRKGRVAPRLGDGRFQCGELADARQEVQWAFVSENASIAGGDVFESDDV
jgi:hypothetical protein